MTWAKPKCTMTRRIWKKENKFEEKKKGKNSKDRSDRESGRKTKMRNWIIKTVIKSNDEKRKIAVRLFRHTLFELYGRWNTASQHTHTRNTLIWFFMFCRFVISPSLLRSFFIQLSNCTWKLIVMHLLTWCVRLQFYKWNRAHIRFSVVTSHRVVFLVFALKIKFNFGNAFLYSYCISCQKISYWDSLVIFWLCMKSKRFD